MTSWIKVACSTVGPSETKPRSAESSMVQRIKIQLSFESQMKFDGKDSHSSHHHIERPV